MPNNQLGVAQYFCKYDHQRINRCILMPYKKVSIIKWTFTHVHIHSPSREASLFNMKATILALTGFGLVALVLGDPVPVPSPEEDLTIEELEERLGQLESKVTSLTKPRLGLNRHANTAVSMFSGKTLNPDQYSDCWLPTTQKRTAYSTATICGVGTMTAWTEALDIGVGSSTTVGTFVAGTHSTTTAGFYLYHASFRCAQGSACDVTCRKTGNRVCAIVNNLVLRLIWCQKMLVPFYITGKQEQYPKRWTTLAAVKQCHHWKHGCHWHNVALRRSWRRNPKQLQIFQHLEIYPIPWAPDHHTLKSFKVSWIREWSYLFSL